MSESVETLANLLLSGKNSKALTLYYDIVKTDRALDELVTRLEASLTLQPSDAKGWGFEREGAVRQSQEREIKTKMDKADASTKALLDFQYKGISRLLRTMSWKRWNAFISKKLTDFPRAEELVENSEGKISPFIDWKTFVQEYHKMGPPSASRPKTKPAVPAKPTPGKKLKPDAGRDIAAAVKAVAKAKAVERTAKRQLELKAKPGKPTKSARQSAVKRAWNQFSEVVDDTGEWNEDAVEDDDENASFLKSMQWARAKIPTAIEMATYAIEGHGVTWAQLKEQRKAMSANKGAYQAFQKTLEKINRSNLVTFPKFVGLGADKNPAHMNQGNERYIALFTQAGIHALASTAYIKMPRRKPIPEHTQSALVKAGAMTQDMAAALFVPDLANIDQGVTFRDNFQILKIDNQFVNILNAKANAEEDQAQVAANSEVIGRLSEIGATTQASNGTPEGKVARFAKCRLVRDKIDASRPAHDLRLGDYERDKETFDKCLPTTPHKAFNDPEFWEALCSGFGTAMEYCDRTMNGLVKINATSDAGLFYQGQNFKAGKIGDNFEAMIVANDQMIQAFATNDKVALEKYEWLRLVEPKAKTEVLNRADYTEKTRIIYVMIAFAMLWPGLLFRAVYDHTTHFMEDPNSLTSFGFSLFNGGAEALINKTKTTSYVVAMADNIYLSFLRNGKRVFASLDGEKFESSINFEDGVSFAAMTIDRLTRAVEQLQGPARDAADRFLKTTTWTGIVNFMLQMFPLMGMSAVAVFSNVQVPVKQMCSGLQGTAKINTAKMVRFVAELKRLYGSSEPGLSQDSNGNWGFPAQWKTAMENVGVSLTIERVTEFENENDPQWNDWMADWLGHCIYTDVDWAIPPVPTLEPDRLYKALLYMKVDLDPEHIDPLTASVVRLGKDTALYLMGGFRIPIIGETLRADANLQIRNIERFIKTTASRLNREAVKEAVRRLLEESLGDLADEATVSSIAAMALNAAIPTIFDIVRAATNKEEHVADQWMEAIIQTRLQLGLTVDTLLPMAPLSWWELYLSGEGYVKPDPSLRAEFEDSHVSEELAEALTAEKKRRANLASRIKAKKQFVAPPPLPVGQAGWGDLDEVDTLVEMASKNEIRAAPVPQEKPTILGVKKATMVDERAPKTEFDAAVNGMLMRRRMENLLGRLTKILMVKIQVSKLSEREVDEFGLACEKMADNMAKTWAGSQAIADQLVTEMMQELMKNKAETAIEDVDDFKILVAEEQMVRLMKDVAKSVPELSQADRDLVANNLSVKGKGKIK